MALHLFFVGSFSAFEATSGDRSILVMREPASKRQVHLPPSHTHSLSLSLYLSSSQGSTHSLFRDPVSHSNSFLC